MNDFRDEGSGWRRKIDLRHPPIYQLLTVTRRLFCCGYLLPVFDVSLVDVLPYVNGVKKVHSTVHIEDRIV